MTLLHQAAQKAVEALTEEERSDLRVGACVFRCPPYDKNPQSQRIADLMERLGATPPALQQPEPVPEPPWWGASLNRRATVEGWMFDAARGKRPMPTPEELRAWAIKLGTPAEGEPALQHQEVPREPDNEAIAAKWNELCSTNTATSWNDKVRAIIQHFASPSTTRQQEAGSGWKLVPVEPTEEMVRAYLAANNAYWQRTDEMPPPPNLWRTGRPFDATAESYKAMIAAAPSTPENAGGVPDGVEGAGDGPR